MKTTLYIVSLFTLLACSGREKSTPATATDSVGATETSRSTQTSQSLPNQPVSKKDSSLPAGKWLYQKTIDKAGRTVYKASITSPTLLQFGFPYAGGSTATLTIRQLDTSTTVYLQVSKGQFNRSYQGGTARIRFDDKPPVPYSFSAAENGSATLIFFDSAQALIDRIKRAGTMIVDVEFYGQGHRQIEFSITDLTWHHD